MNKVYRYIGQPGFVRKLGRTLANGSTVNNVPKHIADGMIEEGVLQPVNNTPKKVKEVTSDVV